MRRKLLLLESDPWRATSLKAFLESEGWDVTPEGARGGVDVILVNLADRPGEFRVRIEELRRLDPKFRAVAFLREVEPASVFPCLALGVKGVVRYDASDKELRSALLCVAEGSIWTTRAVLSDWIDRIASLGLAGGGTHGFTRSERRVLDGIADELTNKEIAKRLGLSEATVKFHVGRLLRKTGATGRRELARFARETLVSLPENGAVAPAGPVPGKS